MKSKLRFNKWIGFLVSIILVIPVWSYSRPAPYYDVWGDVYRGWPFPYGLDQGDVIGEFLFTLAYFNPIAWVIDAILPATFGYLIFIVLKRLNPDKTEAIESDE